MKKEEVLKSMAECLTEYDLAHKNKDKLQCREMVGRMWVYLKVLRLIKEDYEKNNQIN